MPGFGKIRVSMVDAANACVFVRAADLGLKGTELPDEIEANPELLKKLAAIRVAASVAMGITKTPEEAAKKQPVPFVGFVSAPQEAKTLTGESIERGSGRSHRPHDVERPAASRAAAHVHAVHGGRGAASRQRRAEAARPAANPEAEIRIAMPSGVLTVAASVRKLEGQWHAEQGAFYRTQRRMFEGRWWSGRCAAPI